MEDRSIRIELAGRAYPLTIHPDEEENIRSAANELNESIARLKTDYPLTDKQDLLAMASRHSQVSQIARLLRIMEQRFTENLTVEELAREANMSVSAFHHHFKAATATSPLQYIKTLRLHRARLMMLHDGLKAGVAADKVGYESGSQFSREYKRFFGNTPSEHAARFRSGQLRIVEG